MHHNLIYYFIISNNGQTFDGTAILLSEHPGEVILACCTGVTIQNFYRVPSILQQTMEGSSVGILLGFANNNYIYTNHIHEMEDAGIYLFDFDNNDIEHNKITSTIYEVVRNGIKLVQNSDTGLGSDNNDIESNYIKKVEGYGVYIDSGCTNNDVFNNVFIDNNHFEIDDEDWNRHNNPGKSSQAKDANNPTTNSWYKPYPTTGSPGRNPSDPNCGNYWNDWGEPFCQDGYDGPSQNNQQNPDGIVDKNPGLDPYLIDGPAATIDNFPFTDFGNQGEPLFWAWP